MHKSVNTIFKTHYVLIVKYIYNLGVHSHLSKCWKCTWSGKGWEPLA